MDKLNLGPGEFRLVNEDTMYKRTPIGEDIKTMLDQIDRILDIYDKLLEYAKSLVVLKDQANGL